MKYRVKKGTAKKENIVKFTVMLNNKLCEEIYLEKNVNEL
jgi:hypothetical protein